MTTPAQAPYTKPAGITYPGAPWPMVGSMWLTVLRLGQDAVAVDGTPRPRGVYGAAFVSYAEGSPLTYSELLVARALPTGSRSPLAALRSKVSITDIWVDSPESVAGGRELWAIPKGLADFDLDTSHRGPLTTTDWSATLERRPVASASFTDLSRVAPRTPFKGVTWQPELPEGGGEKSAVLQGTAKTLPARARWDFAADGPLGWLQAARPLASVRMASFRMSFG
ncbi:acetoacetate decarboxylase family protein [Nocardioides litoris]|uniref:acetoacetate decarboxylase family protein n=1 Tax=Nocardioides litoris TaxID=1926648 RepID=UPI00111D76AD|nr:acetoacetate decarboxylase family protein [Nocardioides litoris]